MLQMGYYGTEKTPEEKAAAFKPLKDMEPAVVRAWQPPCLHSRRSESCLDCSMRGQQHGSRFRCGMLLEQPASFLVPGASIEGRTLWYTS